MTVDRLTNLVARLREAGPYLRTCHTEGHWNTEREAADCEAAAAEIERLRSVIQHAIDDGDFCQECAVAKYILRPGLDRPSDRDPEGNRNG